MVACFCYAKSLEWILCWWTCGTQRNIWPVVFIIIISFFFVVPLTLSSIRSLCLFVFTCLVLLWLVCGLFYLCRSFLRQFLLCLILYVSFRHKNMCYSLLPTTCETLFLKIGFNFMVTLMHIRKNTRATMGSSYIIPSEIDFFQCLACDF